MTTTSRLFVLKVTWALWTGWKGEMGMEGTWTGTESTNTVAPSNSPITALMVAMTMTILMVLDNDEKKRKFSFGFDFF